MLTIDLTLLLIVMGLIIGLGAVTVIDIHGFLGRKSKYWTEATTKTHKVTKPLIWIGMLLFTVGSIFTYDGALLLTQLIIVGALVLNGLMLSFSVSPYLIEREVKGTQSELLPKSWQNKITASFIVSFLGWWASVLLFIVHIS
jgi:hypothetical protein